MITMDVLDVLIVDDDQNMRRTLGEIVAESGYMVRQAASGEEAVEICRTLPVRVVMMDVRMAGIDGIEASRQIHETSPDTQIILMSAYTQPAITKTGQAGKGILAFLPKPLDLAVVEQLIAGAMELARGA